MRKTDLIAAGLAATLALGSAIVPAAAYLTGNALAKAEVPVAPLALQTTLHEDVTDLQKTVTITAEDGFAPVWVRVMVLQGETFGVTIDADGWTQDGDWWYYDEPLQPGQSTEKPLVATIDDIPGGDKALAGESFNVVVIHECSPVLYKENGDEYADWDLLLDNGEAQADNQGEGE